jgi:tRNA nucleotidyltransferase (CCA-adding enzyme)
MALEEAHDPEHKPEQLLRIRFATLLHDVGKGLTPHLEWPRHLDHDINGVPEVLKFCERLHVPNDLRDCAVVACREHMRVHRFLEMRKGKMVDLVKAADRTRMRTEGLARVCQADCIGRIPAGPSEGACALEIAAKASRGENGHPIPPSLRGEHIGLHIRNKKGNAVRRALREAGVL